MRVTLLAALAAAALLVPVAVWYRPASAPAAATTAADERSDPVEVATAGDQLPFGCPGTAFCNCYYTARIAVLVQDDALWLGSNHGYFSPPVRLARADGGEWAALRHVLLPVADQHHYKLEVALDDRATYSDLLLAMATAREAGFRTFQLVQPALPVYPNHGWEGGMQF